MLTKNIEKSRGQVTFVSIEDLVPCDHLVRDLDKAIDFNFIYPLVEDLYCKDNGRPSIDPVCLFKILFTQYIFGIRSLRQTVKEIEVNMAYRWFVGLDITDQVPHFSTIGKNYERRFKDTKIFEDIFSIILEEAINDNFVKADEIFIDSTHIKASANKHKTRKVLIHKEAKKYKYKLDKEIREDREEHNKKPFDDDNGDGESEIVQSTTDPDSGEFHKGEHEKMFAYSAHTVCDRNNFILATEVTSGNIHDSVVFEDIYLKAISKFPNTKHVVMDAGYKTPYIAKLVFDDDREPIFPYTRPKTGKDKLSKREYVYDSYYDHYICPNGEILYYSTTNRQGYKEYKSNSKTCKLCELKGKCTVSKQKTVTRHLWQKYIDKAEEQRLTPEHKAIYKKRSETIERVFADAKEKHGMRYTQYRGKERVKNSIILTFACMNLKKLAKWKKKIREESMELIHKIQEKISNIPIKLKTPTNRQEKPRTTYRCSGLCRQADHRLRRWILIFSKRIFRKSRTNRQQAGKFKNDKTHRRQIFNFYANIY